MIKFNQIRKKLNEMGAGGAGGGIANVAGSGAIAGLGVGPQGEPPGPKAVLARIRRKKTENKELVESKRDYKAEYKNYHSKSEQKKNRAKRNYARRLLTRLNRVHKSDGKDVDHQDSNPQNNDIKNLRVLKASTNRSMNEVFSKVKSYKWTVHGPEINQAEFEVDKNDKIRVTFKKLDASKNDWEVDFARSNMDTKHDFTTARLTTGFSYEILSTVLEAIKEFVKDMRPDSLWITGIGKGDKSDSRTKLYDTMTKLLPQKIGYKLTHRQDLGGSVVWVLQPKNKLNEETFAGHRVFKVKSEYYHRCRMGKKKFLRYEKYVGNDEFGEEIRKYGRKNHKTGIIVQDEATGAMVYLRKERK